MCKKGHKFGPMFLEHKQKISIATKGLKKPSLIGNQHAKGHKPNKTSFWKGMIAPMRGKLNLKIQKEKHWNWKGGITREVNKIRGALNYKIWRREVFIRNNWTCQKCSKRDGDMIAHHIKSFGNNPIQRTKVKNGITLCEICHDDFHHQYGRGKNNSMQLKKFLKEQDYAKDCVLKGCRGT